MALKGSFTTSAYSNRSLTFSWTATQSTADNQSTISWTLKGSGSASSYYMSAPFEVTIDGSVVYTSSTRIQLKNGTLVASGTKTITHDTSGKKSFSASVKGAIYSMSYNVSGSGSWDLDTIPRAATLTAAPNFNDEGNPTITYSNPAGNNVTSLQACISLDGQKADIAYRDITKTGTSYTFNLTEAERDVLRNATTTANSRTVSFFVKTIIGGNTYHSILYKTFSVINATPTFTSSVKDTGGASTALTGSTAGNVSMIKGFNYMDCSMIATAYKGATISKYKISNGSNAVEAAAATFNNSESNSFKFEVWDSRGNYNSYTTTVKMIDYIPLTCNVDGKIILSTADNTRANVSFTVQGNYFNGSFGAVANSLALDYTIADEENNTVATDTIEATLQGNTYTIDINVDELDYRKSYVVYVAAADAINSVTANSKTLKATPIFDWGEEDFNFNVPLTIQGNTLSDFVIEQGKSNGWNFRRWASGIGELWLTTEPQSVAINTAWGSLYTHDNAFPSYIYPFTFVSLPTVTVYPHTTNGNFWLFTGNGATVEQSPTVSLVRPTALSVTASLSYYVIGRWK